MNKNNNGRTTNGHQVEAVIKKTVFIDEEEYVVCNGERKKIHVLKDMVEGLNPSEENPLENTRVTIFGTHRKQKKYWGFRAVVKHPAAGNQSEHSSRRDRGNRKINPRPKRRSNHRRYVRR